MLLSKYPLQCVMVSMMIFNLAGQIFAQTLIVPDSTIRWDYLNSDTVRSIKTIFTYDDSNRVTEEIEQRWSLREGIWKNEARMVSQYNAFALDTLTQYQHVVTWLPTDREFHTYHDGRRTGTTNQEWDASSSNWQNQTQTTFSWGQGISSASNKVWDQDRQIWSQADSTVTVLNDLGFALSDTGYTWLALGGLYFYNHLTVYHYNNDNQLIQRLRHRYEPDSNRFLLRSRDTFAYDHQGFQVLSQFDAWSRSQQQWIPSFRIERTPNAEGLLDESKLYFPDIFSGELALNSRLVYTYSDRDAAQGGDTLVATVKNFVYQGGIEVPDWIIGYFYPDQSTTANDYPSFRKTITVFPNPAWQYISIKGDTNGVSYYSWISTDGKLLDRRPYLEPMTLPGEHGGILLLLLQDQKGHTIHMQRVMVQK